MSTERAKDGDVLSVVVPELGLVGGFGEFDGDWGAAVAGEDGAPGAGADLADGGLVGLWLGRGGGGGGAACPGLGLGGRPWWLWLKKAGLGREEISVWEMEFICRERTGSH